MKIIEDEGILIKPKKYNFKSYQEGLSVLELQKNKEYAYVDLNGYIAFKIECYNAFQFKEELAIIENESHKFGFIDKKGEFVIPCIYDEVHSFSEGVAIVKKDGVWGAIDKKGSTVVPFKYVGLSDCKDGMIGVSPGEFGNKGYINIKNGEFISNKYCNNNQYSNGLVSVFNGDRWGYMDKKGKIVIPFEYEYAGDFKDGIALVKRNGLYGYINKKGASVLPCVYRQAYDFIEDLAVVKNTDSYRVIDRYGTYINIKEKYDRIYSFSDGLARVLKNGKYGFIDKSGNEVIPCMYDEASDFKDGVSSVKVGEIVYEINKKNEVVFSHEYIKCSTLSSNNLKDDTKKLYSIASYCQIALSVKLYYDLIVDDNIITFDNIEDREKMKLNILQAQKTKVLR